MALDFKGVSLSCKGSVELVALVFDSTSSQVLFLVDHGRAGRTKMECLATFCQVFECPTVVKVIQISCVVFSWLMPKMGSMRY